MVVIRALTGETSIEFLVKAITDSIERYNVVLKCTQCAVLEDVEGVKLVAPPPTAHMVRPTRAFVGAICSL